MLVYLLTFKSGKKYVGQTVRSMQARMTGHRAAIAAGSQLAVHCAWRRHGEPTIEVLRVCGTMAELHEAETAAILEHGTLSPGGYNISRGGDTAPSKNPEVAAKIAEKARGRAHKDEARAQIADTMRVRWEDDEYRAKVAAGIQASLTNERRGELARNTREAWERRNAAGFTVADSTREKIATYERTPEMRAKMSAAAKARVREPFSEEHKTKIAERVKRNWTDPEVTARRVAAIREGHARRKAAIERGEIQPHKRTPEHTAAIAAAKARKRQAAKDA